jgi:hypothetical protein
VSDQGVITERGTFLVNGVEHGLLPPEPPESPPNTFHDGDQLYEIDPDQCAAYYLSQGKVLPSAVPLALPDGTTETHGWAEYGHRFRAFHREQVAGAPLTTAPRE